MIAGIPVERRVAAAAAPAALRIALAAAVGLFLGSCAHSPDEDGDATEDDDKGDVAPADSAKEIVIGEIAAVNQRGGYVLIRLWREPRRSLPGEILTTRSPWGGAASEVRLSPQRARGFAAADFDGSPPAVGDHVIQADRRPQDERPQEVDDDMLLNWQDAP